MAYAQWIYMLINNLTASGNLTIKDLNITWGKFYEWSNKDHEITANKVSEQVAAPSSQIAIASCGRSDAASGTEGSFDLYDDDTKVCHIYWDSPWGAKDNTFTASDIDENYSVEATGQDGDSGAIGTVTVNVEKLG